MKPDDIQKRLDKIEGGQHDDAYENRMWLITQLRASLERERTLEEALQYCADNQCSHPDNQLATNSKIDRDWCSDCRSWVYRGEENVAKEALDRVQSLRDCKAEASLPESK